MLVFQQNTLTTPGDQSLRPLTMQTLPSLLSTADEKIKPKTGKLVYYPKPIPPPEVLPLTRTVSHFSFQFEFVKLYCEVV